MCSLKFNHKQSRELWGRAGVQGTIGTGSCIALSGRHHSPVFRLGPTYVRFEESLKQSHSPYWRLVSRFSALTSSLLCEGRTAVSTVGKVVAGLRSCVL